ncbi:tigger transposable element-derived protein 1-like [Palaemon carinicauda]|uniref:tigger transposable element-derived protein 1-like n=1 Tax=Palaemon carinicauda TaxID=392227 RepID=UPI0035B5BAB6
MCGNAQGFMLKPALIYKSQNPRVLKHKNKNCLPIHWMSNPKAWITKALTSDWYHQCFIPQEKNLLFKIVLLMDNAGGHATNLMLPGVQVEFLPPNTTSLIQSMDQGVIRVFKALYTKNALADLVAKVDDAHAQEDFNLKAYWRTFTIAMCLENIQKALEEMKPSTINSSWKKLLPEIIYDDEGFTPAEIQHSAVKKAVKLAAIPGGEGFADMITEDVDELLDCHSQELTEEDLEELTKSASEEEDDSEEGEKEDPHPGLTLERIVTICRLLKEAQALSREYDEDMILSLQFCNNLDGGMQPYKVVLEKIKKDRRQLPITIFERQKKFLQPKFRRRC